MGQRHNRRGFLAALGASSFALAGCAAIDDQSPNEANDDNGTRNAETGDAESEDEESEEPDEPQDVTPPAIDHGELLDDFGTADDWNPIEGEVRGDGETALVGEQSLRIENAGSIAGAFRAFPDGLDVEGHNLSMAVRVDSPRPVRIALEIDAPARSDQLQAVRTVLGDHEGWLRMDAGWTSSRGEPNLGNIQEMRIYANAGEETEIRFWIDDLRATPAADQGYVILSFDDGVASQYTNALPILEAYDYPAVAAVIPNGLNREGRLHIDQLREMRDMGWDISSHPDPGMKLTELDAEAVRQRIESDQEYLDNRGFPDGARHMFVPYHAIDQEVIDIVRDYHESCFYFAGNTSNVPPTDAMHLSRVDMHDFEGFTRLIDAAAEHNQLTVGLAHGVVDEEEIGEDPLADMTTQQLEELLEYIEESDIEVITPSQLLDGV